MNEKDYVRTKYGITQYKVYKSNMGNLLCMPIKNGSQGIFANKEDVIKSNSNILDILEPMDLLYIDISPDNCGGIVVPRIPETLDELEKYIEKIKSGEYFLKYVVTHEQLENNMYEVGE